MIYFIPPKPTNLHDFAIAHDDLSTLPIREFIVAMIDMLDEPADRVVAVTATQLNVLSKFAQDIKFVGGFLNGVESPNMDNQFMYTRDSLAWPSANVTTYTGKLRAESPVNERKEMNRRIRDMSGDDLRDEIKGKGDTLAKVPSDDDAVIGDE